MTEEQIAEFKEAFSLFDKDGNGIITTYVFQGKNLVEIKDDKVSQVFLSGREKLDISWIGIEPVDPEPKARNDKVEEPKVDPKELAKKERDKDLSVILMRYK